MHRFHQKTFAWLGLALLIFLILWAMIQFGLISSYHKIALVTIMLNIIYATGLNLVLGVAGQFSLGHAGFIAIGAYASAIITTKFSLSPVLGLVLAMLVAMGLGIGVSILVGYPTLRLKGDYLAIATLGVSEIIRVLINNLKGLTNGPAGIAGLPRITDWWQVYFLMIFCLVIILNYTHSSAGRVTLAINQDEIAAEAMGVEVTKYKLFAFVIAAMTAAMGGVLQANFLGIVTPSDYSFNRSIDILIIVVFGGIGSFTGTIISAIVLGLLNLFLQDYGQLRMVLYALALILIMIFRPEGLLGKSELNLPKLLNMDDKSLKKEGA